MSAKISAAWMLIMLFTVSFRDSAAASTSWMSTFISPSGQIVDRTQARKSLVRRERSKEALSDEGAAQQTMERKDNVLSDEGAVQPMGVHQNMIDSKDLTDVTDENRTDAEPVWTPFFSSLVGKKFVFGHFENHRFDTDGNSFFERLPPNATHANTRIRATVSAGSCGIAAIEFDMNLGIQAYLTKGKQGAWQHLQNVKVVEGTVPNVPNVMWTGSGANKGWILSNQISHGVWKTFASSYALNHGWDYCNSAPLIGGEGVTLSYISPKPS
eukprot:gnl/TRDRNA2_/TRDRNA2_136929_c0_seq1.p1 gnl/TRDRNA2_/TRDRNA2_136929_c0~~gnl/TRDRNA2_/TRDRNA2_136929_c0_seq1.p1  ORF type:complete len:296 (-),score=19.84 gnl/TRDRNA2_/TRDRNA2_136929_c0_seq1:44-853(-)